MAQQLRRNNGVRKEVKGDEYWQTSTFNLSFSPWRCEVRRGPVLTSSPAPTCHPSVQLSDNLTRSANAGDAASYPLCSSDSAMPSPRQSNRKCKGCGKLARDHPYGLTGKYCQGFPLSTDPEVVPPPKPTETTDSTESTDPTESTAPKESTDPTTGSTARTEQDLKTTEQDLETLQQQHEALTTALQKAKLAKEIGEMQAALQALQVSTKTQPAAASPAAPPLSGPTALVPSPPADGTPPPPGTTAPVPSPQADWVKILGDHGALLMTPTTTSGSLLTPWYGISGACVDQKDMRLPQARRPQHVRQPNYLAGAHHLRTVNEDEARLDVVADLNEHNVLVGQGLGNGGLRESYKKKKTDGKRVIRRVIAGKVMKNPRERLVTETMDGRPEKCKRYPTGRVPARTLERWRHNERKRKAEEIAQMSDGWDSEGWDIDDPGTEQGNKEAESGEPDGEDPDGEPDGEEPDGEPDGEEPDLVSTWRRTRRHSTAREDLWGQEAGCCTSLPSALQDNKDHRHNTSRTRCQQSCSDGAAKMTVFVETMQNDFVAVTSKRKACNIYMTEIIERKELESSREESGRLRIQERDQRILELEARLNNNINEEPARKRARSQLYNTRLPWSSLRPSSLNEKKAALRTKFLDPCFEKLPKNVVKANVTFRTDDGFTTDETRDLVRWCVYFKDQASLSDVWFHELHKFVKVIPPLSWLQEEKREQNNFIPYKMEENARDGNVASRSVKDIIEKHLMMPKNRDLLEGQRRGSGMGWTAGHRPRTTSLALSWPASHPTSPAEIYKQGRPADKKIVSAWKDGLANMLGCDGELIRGKAERCSCERYLSCLRTAPVHDLIVEKVKDCVSHCDQCLSDAMLRRRGDPPLRRLLRRLLKEDDIRNRDRMSVDCHQANTTTSHTGSAKQRLGMPRAGKKLYRHSDNFQCLNGLNDEAATFDLLKEFNTGRLDNDGFRAAAKAKKTAEVTRKKIQDSRGGVLLIDEAYRLTEADSSSKDVGKEALEELMSVKEGGDPVMIFAGYPDEMASFLDVTLSNTDGGGQTEIRDFSRITAMQSCTPGKRMLQHAGVSASGTSHFGAHAGDQLAVHPFLHYVNCETKEKKNHVQTRRFHLATQRGGGHY
ncbi:hypothetical protein Bbelb_344260 [Branchiostoma belcheri]|nr:hypothetical protein Bbelb_344260 [Branchiostoma belcheri]